MRLKSYLFFLFIISFSSIQAQDADTIRDLDREHEHIHKSFSEHGEFLLGGGINAIIPVGDFDDAMQSTGVGGQFSFGFRPKKAPFLTAMFQIGGNILERQRQAASYSVLGFPREYQIRVRNSVFIGDLGLRLHPTWDMMAKPYIEPKLGLRNFYSRSVLFENETDNAYNQLDERVEDSDWSIAYGAGVGVALEVGAHFLIDLNVSFIRTAEVNYWAPDPTATGIPISNFRDSYRRYTGITESLTPSVGFIFRFYDAHEDHAEDDRRRRWRRQWDF